MWRVAAACVLTMAVAGCGSGAGVQSAVTPAPSASVPAKPLRHADFAAYRECMSAHGIQPPTARPPGTRPTRDPAEATAFEAARRACAPLRPKGGLRPGGFRSGARASFVACMAKHGVPVHREHDPAPPTGEPRPAPGHERGGLLTGLDRNDPRTKAALKACEGALRPTT